MPHAAHPNLTRYASIRQVGLFQYLTTTGASAEQLQEVDKIDIRYVYFVFFSLQFVCFECFFIHFSYFLFVCACDIDSCFSYLHFVAQSTSKCNKRYQEGGSCSRSGAQMHIHTATHAHSHCHTYDKPSLSFTHLYEHSFHISHTCGHTLTHANERAHSHSTLRHLMTQLSPHARACGGVSVSC